MRDEGTRHEGDEHLLVALYWRTARLGLKLRRPTAGDRVDLCDTGGSTFWVNIGEGSTDRLLLR